MLLSFTASILFTTADTARTGRVYVLTATERKLLTENHTFYCINANTTSLVYTPHPHTPALGLGIDPLR